MMSFKKMIAVSMASSFLFVSIPFICSDSASAQLRTTSSRMEKKAQFEAKLEDSKGDMGAIIDTLCNLRGTGVNAKDAMQYALDYFKNGDATIYDKLKTANSAWERSGRYGDTGELRRKLTDGSTYTTNTGSQPATTPSVNKYSKDGFDVIENKYGVFVYIPGVAAVCGQGKSYDEAHADIVNKVEIYNNDRRKSFICSVGEEMLGLIYLPGQSAGTTTTTPPATGTTDGGTTTPPVCVLPGDDQLRTVTSNSQFECCLESAKNNKTSLINTICNLSGTGMNVTESMRCALDYFKNRDTNLYNQLKSANDEWKKSGRYGDKVELRRKLNSSCVFQNGRAVASASSSCVFNNNGQTTTGTPSSSCVFNNNGQTTTASASTSCVFQNNGQNTGSASTSCVFKNDGQSKVDTSSSCVFNNNKVSTTGISSNCVLKNLSGSSITNQNTQTTNSADAGDGNIRCKFSQTIKSDEEIKSEQNAQAQAQIVTVRDKASEMANNGEFDEFYKELRAKNAPFLPTSSEFGQAFAARYLGESYDSSRHNDIVNAVRVILNRRAMFGR